MSWRLNCAGGSGIGSVPAKRAAAASCSPGSTGRPVGLNRSRLDMCCRTAATVARFSHPLHSYAPVALPLSSRLMRSSHPTADPSQCASQKLASGMPMACVNGVGSPGNGAGSTPSYGSAGRSVTMRNGMPSAPKPVVVTCSVAPVLAGSASPRQTGFGAPLIVARWPLRPHTEHPRSPGPASGARSCRAPGPGTGSDVSSSAVTVAGSRQLPSARWIHPGGGPLPWSTGSAVSSSANACTVAASPGSSSVAMPSGPQAITPSGTGTGAVQMSTSAAASHGSISGPGSGIMTGRPTGRTARERFLPWCSSQAARNSRQDSAMGSSSSSATPSRTASR